MRFVIAQCCEHRHVEIFLEQIGDGHDLVGIIVHTCRPDSMSDGVSRIVYIIKFLKEKCCSMHQAGSSQMLNGWNVIQGTYVCGHLLEYCLHRLQWRIPANVLRPVAATVRCVSAVSLVVLATERLSALARFSRSVSRIVVNVGDV